MKDTAIVVWANNKVEAATLKILYAELVNFFAVEKAFDTVKVYVYNHILFISRNKNHITNTLA